MAAFSSIPCTDAGFAQAGDMIRAGQCVAFPTETVYGLGANALDEEAVARIFKFKGRPLTDPLITHVASVEDARALVELPEAAEPIFTALAAAFWPGPLTLVAKAAPVIPASVTANTGFVGIRIPSHPIARALISAARVPIAAPSANRFGHVSPTRAAHVIADLGAHPIGVLTPADDAAAECAVGIESTVVKVDAETASAAQLIVYRRGGVSIQSLHSALVAAGLGHVPIVVRSQHAPAITTKGAEAPGMLLTHYAPDVPAFLVTSIGTADAVVLPPDAVIVDFGGRLLQFAHAAIAYVDLSPKADVVAARKRIFDVLRWAESFPAAKAVLLMDPSVVAPDEEHVDSLRDRMYRAASGRELRLLSLPA